MATLRFPRASCRSLLLRGYDPQADRHFFLAEPAPDAAHRRGRMIVETDGEAHIGFGGLQTVRGIEPHPAEPVQEDLGPGMARLLDAALAVCPQIAADIARRHGFRARRGDEEMGMVLADAHSFGQRLLGPR